MEWRIYYGDMKTYSNEDGSPKDAPPWNVQAIVQKHIESGRYITSHYDYYVYRDDRWFGVDVAGIVDYLQELGLLRVGSSGQKIIFMNGETVPVDAFDIVLYLAKSGFAKMGRTLTKEHFLEVYRIAESDPDFPKRTAYRSNEWKPGDSDD